MFNRPYPHFYRSFKKLFSNGINTKILSSTNEQQNYNNSSSSNHSNSSSSSFLSQSIKATTTASSSLPPIDLSSSSSSNNDSSKFNYSSLFFLPKMQNNKTKKKFPQLLWNQPCDSMGEVKAIEAQQNMRKVWKSLKSNEGMIEYLGKIIWKQQLHCYNTTNKESRSSRGEQSKQSNITNNKSKDEIRQMKITKEMNKFSLKMAKGKKRLLYTFIMLTVNTSYN